MKLSAPYFTLISLKTALSQDWLDTSSSSIQTHTIEMQGSLLWCMTSFRKSRDPNSLPNDRCCPFINFDENDSSGTPYSSTVNGCCNTQLYDVSTQICCQETGQVVNINDDVQKPSGIRWRQKGDNEVQIWWDESPGAVNYAIFVFNFIVSEPFLPNSNTFTTYNKFLKLSNFLQNVDSTTRPLFFVDII